MNDVEIFVAMMLNLCVGCKVRGCALACSTRTQVLSFAAHVRQRPQTENKAHMFFALERCCCYCPLVNLRRACCGDVFRCLRPWDVDFQAGLFVGVR